MSGLNASLNIGLSGLQASQAALNVVGHNIANVNTPNYSRQQAILKSNGSQTFGNLQFGMGVTVNNILGVRDKFLDLRITQATSAKSGADVRYSSLEAVASVFTENGEDSDLGTLVQNFFKGFQELSSKPEDGSIRTNVVGKAQSLINGIKSRYELLEAQRTQADKNIGSLVTEVNTLTAEIAKLNARIATETTEGADSDARDQRQGLANELAALVGVQTFEDSHGQLQVTLDGGKGVLVNGSKSGTMMATQNAATGFSDVTVSFGSGTPLDVSTSIKEGSLGANLDLRDDVLAGYQQKLDELAAGIAGQVNLVQRGGYSLTGASMATTDFFGQFASNGADGLPTTVAAVDHYKGRVNALTVNVAVVSNTDLIAASGTGAAGDNMNARKLAALETAANTVDTNGDGVGDSGPFSTVIGSLVNTLGTDAQGYETRSTEDENLLTALQTQRDRVSAVDLDEEATTMLTFQRGYQASARFISVINQLMDQLVNNFGQ